jgi:hypothetical protein
MNVFDQLYKSLILEFSEGAIKKLIAKFSDVDEQTVRLYLDKFEKYKNGIEKKDPFQYKSFQELEQVVDAAEGKASFKNKKAPQQNAEPTVNSDDVLVDDENVTIYKGDSQDKCILYGRGYTFCISRQAGGNMYSNYRSGKESTFYFIYFKKKPRTATDHIMVLDNTNRGYEWTFADNDTRTVKGGWDEIVQKYPELENYKDLLSNKKLDDAERAELENIKKFIKKPTLEKFQTFDYSTQIKALKSGSNIPDTIYQTLDPTLINEFLSVGPNLTTYQADSLKENQLRWYLKNRNIQVEQFIKNNIYRFNKHDVNIPFIKDKIDTDTKKAEIIVSNYEKNKNINLNNLFLVKLPSNIPNVIDGAFGCNGTQITSLEGAPEKVGGGFYCSRTPITSLEGAPEKVGGGFYCSRTPITSLEGAPKQVGGDFYCNYTQITSLQGAPEKVGGGFYCGSTQITSLEGAPEKVGGSFDCIDTEITSLEGAPEKVGGGFYCSRTPITSLEGAPKQVGGDFYCNDTKIKSLSGAPEKVGGDFYCIDTEITSLEGEPEKFNPEMLTWADQFRQSLNNEIKTSMISESRKYTQLELLENLRDWFAPHVDKKGKKFKGWINCKTGGPCGRNNTSKGSYPACRPTKAQCKSIKGKMYKKKSSERVAWKKSKKKSE